MPGVNVSRAGSVLCVTRETGDGECGGDLRTQRPENRSVLLSNLRGTSMVADLDTLFQLTGTVLLHQCRAGESWK